MIWTDFFKLFIYGEPDPMTARKGDPRSEGITQVEFIQDLRQDYEIVEREDNKDLIYFKKNLFTPLNFPKNWR